MRRLTGLTAVVLAAVSLGCDTAANTTNVRTNGNVNANSNVAVVVNNNANVAGNGSSSSVMNSNVSRADYDRDRAKYEADKGTSTIGTGANDSWIWFKTKSALATTDGLRDSTINVDVSNAVVTLRGTVASKVESDKAAAAAKAIEGVTSVTNSLKVQAGDSMTNQMVNGNSSSTNATNANAKK